MGATLLYRNRSSLEQICANVRAFDLPTAGMYDALVAAPLGGFYARVADEVQYERDDTITGSDQYDEIYGLEGDDLIDPVNDFEQDYVSCGLGFETVNQKPILGAPSDVIESDCEVVVL